ncbi:MAG TPA: glutamate--tRNA ligase [Vicinamibacterales bacterium]|nr:glutamate--tRNA ligase [Vicinamibacterales bacterium]
MSVRLRFAPSPTGYLHVGGARTALFNWLYARRHGGTFVLRIEDTDAERSSSDMVTGILTSLRWLGLEWDEGPEVGGPYGPYFQTQRLDRHRDLAQRLMAAGRAYYCYCTPQELQAKRAAAEAAGSAWMYDRTCASLSPAEIASREAAGLPRAVRVRVPDGETTFEDLVHGPITVSHASIEDFVIVRSDGSPTYQLSVVADDIDMRITHVVRGDDHISNTPKQILLYRAVGAPVPAFAHVPLILGPDKKRLSKRHGATSVGEYESRGYLPEAMVNFLALLGWSPGSGDREVFTADELVARFDLAGISGGNAVFNPEKLQWFNQQHIMRLDADAIVARIRPLLESAGEWRSDFEASRRVWLRSVIDLLKPRAHTLGDFVALLRPFLVERVERDPAAAAKHLSAPDVASHLAAWRDQLRDLPSFDATSLEAALRALADVRGIKAGVLIHATRVAVTGQSASPGLFEVLELVGRDRVLARIDDVLQGRPVQAQ